MKKWLLVEAVPGPEKGIAGPLVSNPHVEFRRFVGVRGSDRCVTRAEVIEQHVDLTKAIAKGSLRLLKGPVVAKDVAAAAELLGVTEPKRKPKSSVAPAMKKEGS